MLRLLVCTGLAFALVVILLLPGCIRQSRASSTPPERDPRDVTAEAEQAFAAGHQIFLYDLEWTHVGAMVTGRVKYMVRPPGSGAFSTKEVETNFCYTPRFGDRGDQPSWDTVTLPASDRPSSLKSGMSGVLPWSVTWRTPGDGRNFDIGVSVTITCVSGSGKRCILHSNTVTLPGDETRSTWSDDAS